MPTSFALGCDSQNPQAQIGHLRAIDRSRFVAARTPAGLGSVVVLGVCIPWHMADVPVGAANAKPWQRHIEFLKQLSDVMSRIGEPIVVEGCEKPGIDHIAISAQLQATQVGGWPKDVTGNRLSDHDGVWAEIT